MTDYYIEETADGRYGVYSAFNDSLLNVFNTKDKAIENARERLYFEDTGCEVIVKYGAKKPDWV